MTAFFYASLIRAIRTAAQAAIAAIGTDAVDIIATDWVGVASLAAGGFVLSLLTSLATGLPETEPS